MSNENKLLGVASSPHVSSPIGTRSLMLDVLIALVPALCAAVFFFGPRALIATAISVVACEIFEMGYRKLLHKTQTNGDLSAAVTGVLLAFVCPVTLPYWMLIIGDFFAIGGQAALRRPGQEFHQPRSGRPCLPDAQLSGGYDHLGCARQVVRPHLRR